MGFGIALAQQAAGQAVQGGMGILLGRLQEKHNDRRQLRQQRQLMNMEMQANREMMKYGKDLDLEMWKNTSYPAQKEMLEKAGLNPALMYGMSGGGGVTTGGSGMGVSGGRAEGNSGEAQAMAQIQGMGLQMGLQAAQIENIKADTNLKNTEANKKGGVDTLEAQSRIAQIAAGIKNTEAQTEILQIDKDLKNIDKEIAGRTIEDKIDIITHTADIALYDMLRLKRRNTIEEVTFNDTVKQIKAEAIGAVLENTLTQATTENTKAKTETEKETRFLTREQARKIGQDIFMGWDGKEMDRQQIQIELQKALGTQNDISGDIIDAVQSILLMRTGVKGLGTPNKIGFKTGGK